MLEVRYNTNTKEITGWWSSRHGNHEVKLENRPDEAIVVLDIPIPEKDCDAYLYDEATQTLIDNPDHIEPEPAMDYRAEILELKAEIKKLKEAK